MSVVTDYTVSSLDRPALRGGVTQTVQPVDPDALSSWPTKRLMGLRQRLLRCEETLETSDVQSDAELDPSVIRFKQDPRWSALYDAVRAVLSTREHVPSGLERKQTRRERARRGG